MICTAYKSVSLLIYATIAPSKQVLGTIGCDANHINARYELLLEAGARYERTL